MAPYKPHLATISSFRVPCAIFVFLHHIEGHFGVPNSAFPFRRIVVSMFLVLSGYLLYSIYGSRARQMSVWDFYRKRVVRIFPLHWMILICVLLLNWSREMGKIMEYPWFFGSKLIAHATLLQCWFPHPEFVLGMNGVTWTLSVILFCYLLFPWLARLGNRLWIVFVAIFLIDLSWIVFVSPHVNFQQISGNNIVHFFPPFRMLEFMSGMLLAQYGAWQFSELGRSRRVLMTVIDVVIAVGAIWLWYRLAPAFPQWIKGIETESIRKELTHWFNMTGFMVPSCLILFWYSMSNGYIAGGMRSRLMVFLGGVSYAFYLCHRPVLLKVESYLSYSQLSTTALVVLCFCIVFGVSTVFYLLAEQPIRRRFGSRSPKSKDSTSTSDITQERTDTLCAVGIVCLGLVVFSYYQAGWPPRRTIVFDHSFCLNLNQIVDRREEISAHFGWQYISSDKPLLIGYHLLDQQNQIITTHWYRRFEPDNSNTSGVFWMHFDLESTPNAASVVLMCLQTGDGEMKIATGNLAPERLLNDGKWYAIWQRGDAIPKRPPRKIPETAR